MLHPLGYLPVTVLLIAALAFSLVYCEPVHTMGAAQRVIDSSMDERALLFGLLGLLLTAAIILAVAPGAVTWAMSLVV